MNHTTSKDQVYIIAATNQIEMLDKACVRRFHKRLKVELPNIEARKRILMSSLDNTELSDHDFHILAADLEKYSGSDLEDLCREVSMRPIKELFDSLKKIGSYNLQDMRRINLADFKEALKGFSPASGSASQQQRN
jgi:SpoVK/Ycf46/Vps4 family AAA+-type ATPase